MVFDTQINLMYIFSVKQITIVLQTFEILKVSGLKIAWLKVESVIKKRILVVLSYSTNMVAIYYTIKAWLINGLTQNDSQIRRVV